VFVDFVVAGVLGVVRKRFVEPLPVAEEAEIPTGEVAGVVDPIAEKVEAAIK